MQTFTHKSAMPVDARTVWTWHTRPGAFGRLTPPWERVRLLKEARLEEGARGSFRVRAGPFAFKWEAEIQDVVPGSQFRDRQVSGPFAHWEHAHRFIHEAADHSCLEDEVHYRLPLGIFGSLAAGAATRAKLRRMFAYRHEVTRLDLDRYFRAGALSPKVVLVSGGSGFIGRELIPLLRTLGHTVRVLSRRPSGEGAYFWDPGAGRLDKNALDGVDAVIHMAGENIAGGRWTRGRRERIARSRIDGTRLLAEAVAAMPSPPAAFVCASGINVYSADGQPHDESGPTGDGFLADVCRKWEGAADAAADAGIRTVFIRTGVVLGVRGGALAKMLLPFRMGFGGPVGDGTQHLSWIAMDDLLDVYVAAISGESMRGPVNATAPGVVPQREFARVLGRVLRRPTVLPLPAFMVKAALGQMGRETLLADLNVLPGVLRRSGFAFRYSALEPALRHLLGRCD